MPNEKLLKKLLVIAEKQQKILTKLAQAVANKPTEEALKKIVNDVRAELKLPENTYTLASFEYKEENKDIKVNIRIPKQDDEKKGAFLSKLSEKVKLLYPGNKLSYTFLF